MRSYSVLWVPRRNCMPDCLEHTHLFASRISLKLMLHSYVQALKAGACLRIGLVMLQRGASEASHCWRL